VANQRSHIQMTPAEVATFLAESKSLVLCSSSLDGIIHAVPMFYGFLGGAVAMHTKAKSQKVRNLERDPRLTVLVEAGTEYDQLRGVELVGRADIVRAHRDVFDLAVDMHERHHGPYTEDLRTILEDRIRGRVAIRVLTERVVSWDHRKLASGRSPAS
jgi:nitroimidazol reductase NimA-like FMN-containing flavoprotein (pyridoxamine 5'-phosphate oxidase superfamily)